MQPYIRPMDILDHKCTVDGTPGGDADATGNYSGGGLGETKFFVEPGPTETFELYSFNLIMTTATAYEAGEYGDGAALATGISLTLEGEPGDDDKLLHDLLGGGAITTNAAWGVVLNIDSVIQSPNSPALMTGTDNFVASIGAPVRIVGALNQRFVVTLNDDMTSILTGQQFSVSGQKVI